jgi:type II secretory ATPase GspE/PulE/Tfp pilus assembly ATPase PilB-like protein
MCELDISERRKPQDGKIKFKKFGPLDIELRVATIPSAGGVEDIVMRILAAGEPIPLDKLGVLPHNLDRLKTVISKPYGLFFVCGPTGSGKTTTLHSVLNYLNKPDTKIWTAEDPVEITQKGLRQVQVNRKTGLDFATAMRAFLRADPDIIMVGEMRDKETVSMGIEASLTGHLVFATLHTNSAPESIVRLLDMGMDPFNFADALLGILAQRLAKRLCTNCKLAYHPSQEEINMLLTEYCEELQNTAMFQKDQKAAMASVLVAWKKKYADDKSQFTLYKAVGCDKCSGGYKGRVGLHELMVGTDRAKKLLQEHARVAQLLAAALEDGMLTLKMDGMEKVLSGITDMTAVRSVCIK